MWSIGLMSGTSMDGIEAALLETDGSANFLKERGHISLIYDEDFKLLLKSVEYAIRKYQGNLSSAKFNYLAALNDFLLHELQLNAQYIPKKITALSHYLNSQCRAQISHLDFLDKIIFLSTELHLTAVKKILAETNHTPQDIDVIGYHGQTMFHQPTLGISLILGDGDYLAKQSGITVINDFRSQDIAAGGFGAPFAPLYHQALAIRDKKIPLAVVNCGGISNITLIQNHNELDLVGFDMGPGNGLIDQLVRRRTQGKENMDGDGKYGKHGKVNSDIFKLLYEKCIIKNGQNYFYLPAPKALDIGDLQLIAELDLLSLEDACRTLEAFTADVIVTSLALVNRDFPKQWILAGGGWRNPIILHELKQRLKQKINDVEIFTADEIGWNSTAMEAQIFAYLAVRSLQNKPISFPGTTNVPSPLTGGRIYYA